MDRSEEQAGGRGESGIEAEDFERDVTEAEAGHPAAGAEAETLAEDRAAVRSEAEAQETANAEARDEAAVDGASDGRGAGMK